MVGANASDGDSTTIQLDSDCVAKVMAKVPASDRVGIDFVHHPGLMNRPDIAAKIAVVGMRDGTFTHHRLGQYIRGSTRDFVDARRIVNDSDRNQEIASYANNYYAALQQCRAIAQIYPKFCPKPT